VIVYCAWDREFSLPILKSFTKETGIEVIPKFDTEATKSVGLFQDLLNEKLLPRCDVYWNNEIINTIRLAEQGVTASYQSPSAAPYPKQYKSAAHKWYAFAARARVILVNTDLVSRTDRPDSILDLTNPKWKAKLAMAKPQFGTTATHAACLFQAWGKDKAERFFEQLHVNAVHIVKGNKQVAEGVGNGVYHLGLTDTDDAMGEVRAGKPVAIVFPDADAPPESGMGALFIPNSLSLIRSSPNPKGGQKLIDYLLSQDVEKRLAESPACQIPLNPNVKVVLPEPMRPALSVTQMKVDFESAAEKWNAAQEFVTSLFAK